MAVVTTSGWAGQISGKIGNAVFVETPHGTTLRERQSWSGSKSPLQMQSELRMAAASRAFGALTREEGQAWAAFGKSLAEAHPKTGRIVGLSAQQAFNRLACKLLQIDPQAVLPRVPPMAPFFGDGVKVTISSLPLGRGRGGVNDFSSTSGQAELKSTPALPSPKGEKPTVLFTADAANREGVLTELLLQPLASQHRRTYMQRYRTKAFVHFTGDDLQAVVPSNASWYAAAIRFVEAATGRATAEIELGVLKVG